MWPGSAHARARALSPQASTPGVTPDKASGGRRRGASKKTPKAARRLESAPSVSAASEGGWAPVGEGRRAGRVEELEKELEDARRRVHLLEVENARLEERVKAKDELLDLLRRHSGGGARRRKRKRSSSTSESDS